MLATVASGRVIAVVLEGESCAFNCASRAAFDAVMGVVFTGEFEFPVADTTAVMAMQHSRPKHTYQSILFVMFSPLYA